MQFFTVIHYPTSTANYFKEDCVSAIKCVTREVSKYLLLVRYKHGIKQ